MTSHNRNDEQKLIPEKSQGQMLLRLGKLACQVPSTNCRFDQCPQLFIRSVTIYNIVLRYQGGTPCSEPLIAESQEEIYTLV